MLVLCAIAAGYASSAGARWAAVREDAVRLVVAEADNVMALRRANFVRMTSEGQQPNFGLIYATALPFRAGLPTGPLAAVSAGQAEGYPAAASISPFVDPWSIFDPHAAGTESPSILAAGRFDPAFVVVVLLPLVLIAATYDIWSGEVESGRARLQLAQPVQPVRLVVWRVAARAGYVLGMSVAVVVGCLAAVGVRDVGGLALVALVISVYGAFWIALSTCISLSVRTSATAAVINGAAWLTLVVLFPASAAAVLDLTTPAASARAHTNAVRAAGLEVRAAHADAAREAAAAPPEKRYPASLWHSRREIQVRDARLEPLHRAYAARGAQRRARANFLRFVSPAVLAQDALDRIAGTDADRALAFQEQARAFAGEVRQLSFDWMDQGRLLTLADYDGGLPRFAFVEPSSAGPQVRNLLALLGFGAVACLGARRRLRRGPSGLL